MQEVFLNSGSEFLWVGLSVCLSVCRSVCLSVCLSVEKMKSAEFGLTVCGKQSGKFLRSLNLFLIPGAEFLWVGLSFCRSVRMWKKIKIQISSNCLNETTKLSSNGTSFKGFQVIIIISAQHKQRNMNIKNVSRLLLQRLHTPRSNYTRSLCIDFSHTCLKIIYNLNFIDMLNFKEKALFQQHNNNYLPKTAIIVRQRGLFIQDSL